MAKRRKPAAQKPAKSNGDVSDKRTPRNFPKNTLEEAIAIARAIEEKNAGKPLDSPTLAKYIGYRQVKDWRYLDLLRSANTYGLVSGTGTTAEVHLEDLGQRIVAPSAPDQRKKALAEAFQRVELFKNVSDFYRGKKIPEDEYLANTLTREFQVPRERVEQFTEIFLRNLEYLKAFAATPQPADAASSTEPAKPQDDRASAKGPESGAREAREFLDTCFVLMPYGGWHDRYYDEIYKPSIKEAGFEPIRADDLFHTGSVMEQIWQQVRKAGVLLAELSGKSANVFYELGLAHALGKPVVFVTGTIDDVPFDLRHLRVIPYDIRDPQWSMKLREGITTYLRNTKKNPVGAIPQPFRELTQERANVDEDRDPEDSDNMGDGES